MTLVGVVRNILLVVVVLGFVAGENECHYYTNVVYYEVVYSAHACVELGFNYEDLVRFQRAKSIEEYQQHFVGYCQKQSLIRECFSNKFAQFERCGNETFVNTFYIYRGILETLLDIGCIRDGESLATFWRGLKILERNESDYYEVVYCFVRVSDLLFDLARNTVDLPSTMYVAYKELKLLQECVLKKKIEASFKEVLDTFFREAINRMKCINPVCGSTVLCSTVDATLLNATSVCDIKTNSNEIPIYDALENQAGRCFDFLVEGDMVEANLTTLRTRYFPRICSSENEYDECLDRFLPSTKQCLNETQLHEFTVFNETIHRSLNAACIEQANYFSGIMIQVYELQNHSPGHKNAVLECLKSVLSARKQTDVVYTSNNMRYYHELETFKECLLQRLQGNESNVIAVNKLYNEIRKTVKCINPENGTTVLCEALVH